MRISVIIVNYNVKYYLEQCLYSLSRALTDIDSEIFVIDNHSNDGSAVYLERRFSNVNFIESNHNQGFARANNIAIRQSEGDYVLLLNPDTIVGESVINKALFFMDMHSKIGGLGVKMLKTDGSFAMESRRGLPTPLTALYKMTGLCTKFSRSRIFGKYYMSYLDNSKPNKIEVISGAFCMLRRSALNKIGLLDENFFMYGEDIDLSYRLLKGGYENWYLPISILHYKGESTHKSSFRYVHVFYKAMYIFFRKHYGHLNILISLPINTAIYFKAFTTLIGMQIHKLRSSLGFFDKVTAEPIYFFIGRQTVLDQCKRLAKRKGLSATFFEADEESVPLGHITALTHIEEGTITYVVYDTDAYSYDVILYLFSQKPDYRVRMGTYNRKTRILITEEEIIK
jgi:N-acetylglucosaminyl-diphospho-decaprenol L-rhamnosyltransferase